MRKKGGSHGLLKHLTRLGNQSLTETNKYQWKTMRAIRPNVHVMEVSEFEFLSKDFDKAFS